MTFVRQLVQASIDEHYTCRLSCSRCRIKWASTSGGVCAATGADSDRRTLHGPSVLKLVQTPTNEHYTCLVYCSLRRLRLTSTTRLSLVAKPPGGKVGNSIETRCAVEIRTVLSVISCVNGPSGDPNGSGHGHATIGIDDVKIESEDAGRIECVNSCITIALSV